MPKELEEKSIEELKFEIETEEEEDDLFPLEEETTEEQLENLNLYLRFNANQSPTVTINSNAGTGASASISGNDTKGTITLTTGSGAWAIGEQVLITFAKNYDTAPIVVLTAADADAATAFRVHDVYATSTTTTFSLNFGVVEAAGVEMVFNFHNLE